MQCPLIEATAALPLSVDHDKSERKAIKQGKNLHGISQELGCLLGKHLPGTPSANLHSLQHSPAGKINRVRNDSRVGREEAFAADVLTCHSRNGAGINTLMMAELRGRGAG